MRSRVIFFAVWLLLNPFALAIDTSKIPLPTDDPAEASQATDAAAYHSAQIPPEWVDVSVPLRPGLAVFSSDKGLDPSFKTLVSDMEKGAQYYATEIKLNVHTGTHVDAPAHFLPEAFKEGNTVDKMDFTRLIGPVYVVAIPEDQNITAALLDTLPIPHDAERLVFKTGNSYRKLWSYSPFASDYTAFTADGAQYIVDKLPHVMVTGIDYVSIAAMDQISEAHKILLGKGIIPVEGLYLEHIYPWRWYQMTCLPVNIVGAEGSPARCVMYGPDSEYEISRDHRERIAIHTEGLLDASGQPPAGSAEPKDNAHREEL